MKILNLRIAADPDPGPFEENGFFFEFIKSDKSDKVAYMFIRERCNRTDSYGITFPTDIVYYKGGGRTRSKDDKDRRMRRRELQGKPWTR